MTLIQFVIINVGALVTAAGGVFLKRLSNQLDHHAALTELALYVIKSYNFWLGGFCYVFPIFLWTYLLKHVELTKLQPQLAIVYFYTIILSLMFLDEIPSLMRLLGISLIIVGVIMVGRS